MNNMTHHYVLPTTYNLTSSPSPFHSYGLSLIYNLSNTSLTYLFTDVNLTSLNTTNPDYIDIVNSNRKIFGYLGGVVLLSLFLLLLGIWWTVSYCCCRKRGGRRKSDAKCTRNFLTLVYSALVLAFMYTVISSAITNEQLKTTIQSLPSQLNSTLSDTSSYFNLTKAQLSSLFITNFNTLESSLLDTLSRAGDFVKNDLVERLNLEESFEQLTVFMGRVSEIHGVLVELTNSSKLIRTKARQLEISLNEARGRLGRIVQECNCAQEVVEEFKREWSGGGEVDINQLPHLNSTLRELSSIINLDIPGSLSRIRTQLTTLSFTTQSQVENNLSKLRAKLNSTRTELGDYNRVLRRGIEGVEERLRAKVEEIRESGVEEKLEKFEFLRYTSTLGALGFLIGILTCLIFTTCIGFCGKQPGSNVECCSRRLGSSFINFSSFLIIISSIGLTVVISGYLVINGTIWLGCEKNVTEIDDYLPKEIEIEGTRLKLPLSSEIINSCSASKSAFNTLKLSSIYNISGLSELSTRFHVKIPTPSISLSLDSIPDLKFNLNSIHQVNFERILASLNQSILSIDLSRVIHELTSVPASDEFESKLLNEIVYLNGINTFIYTPLISLVNKSVDGIRRVQVLRDELDLVGVEKLLRELGQEDVGKEVEMSISHFEDVFFSLIRSYSNYTLDSILTSVGQCYPLYKIYSNNRDYLCTNLKLPSSGLWLCLNLILLSYLPLLLLGRGLNNLFRRVRRGTSAYRADVVETNYLGDSYSSDTIPLNTNNERKNRASSSRNQSRVAQTRFGDKPWEQQHHQPTHPASDEYERPPPYYYPGPAGQ